MAPICLGLNALRIFDQEIRRMSPNNEYNIPDDFRIVFVYITVKQLKNQFSLFWWLCDCLSFYCYQQ